MAAHDYKHFTISVAILQYSYVQGIENRKILLTSLWLNQRGAGQCVYINQ